MSRAYLRLDPGAFERKVIQQDYPPATFAAFVGVLCLAESQPERGRFRDERLLRALLGKLGRQVPDLISLGDLVVLADGRLYLDGWDEWQEGDVTVRDRVARVRARKRPPVTVATATPVTERTVYTPSEHSVIEAVGGRHSGTIPPPPTSGGRRKDRTNPRANGTAPRDDGSNPRANGASPRQARAAEKRAGMPSSVAEILRRAASEGVR